MARRPGRGAMFFILVTVFLDAVGLGIVIPVTPELIMELTGEGLSMAAVYGGWLVVAYAAMQFLFAPVIGNLSDRFGRRPVLLVSLLAFGLNYIIMGLAPTLVWLFVGRLAAGVAGATAVTANAYVADITPPEQRSRKFGLLGAAWGLGFVAGPVIGGLLGDYGARLPFFAAAGVTLLNAAYGFLILPETLAKEKRRPFSWKRANTLGAWRQMRRYPAIIGLLSAFLLYQIAHDANPSTWTYYTMLKFQWTEREVGFSMALIGLMVVLVMGGLTQLVIPRLGEVRAVYLGFGMGTAGFIGFAFATEGWMMYAWIVPWSLLGLAVPALRGIMVNQVPEDAQGELQGAITSLTGFTAIVAPFLMTQLFHLSTADPGGLYFPGAPFLTAALMLFGSVVLVFRTMRRVAP